MSTLATTNIKHPSSASNNIVLDSAGGVDLDALTVSGSAPADSVNIDASGRLLVGTSSYAGNGKLIAAGNTGGDAGTLDICWTGSRPTAANTDIGYIRWYVAENSSSNAHYASIYASSDGASSSTSDIPGRLVFSTTADGASSPTERMRIDNAGSVMVGCTVRPSSGNVTGVFSEPGIITIGSTNSAGQDRMRFETPSGRVGSIQTSGSSTIYATSSDYRLKENITAVPDGIARLQQLKPSRFNFIVDPDHTVDGFIAHEAQAVVPECVTGEKDAIDADGNPVYQGIDQSKLVPLLTAALQEAVTRIETLEAAVTALQGE